MIRVNWYEAFARWVGLVLVDCRYVWWMNSPTGSVGCVKVDGFELGSGLDGYEVRFVTTMFRHQHKLLVVLVAKGFKMASKAYSLRRCQASDHATSFLARLGLRMAWAVLAVVGLIWV